MPAKKKTASRIVTPRTAQETLISQMPRRRPTTGGTLRVGGNGLVEGVDRVMRRPEDHQALGIAVKPGAVPNGMKVARIYLRVSAEDQDLTRQGSLVESTRAAGFYVAGVYREKASGARADRPELLRMVADLQPGEVVVAEKIDRISRLPLAEAEQLVAAIRAKGARLAVPGVVDLTGC